MTAPMSYRSLYRSPDQVRVIAADNVPIDLQRSGDRWTGAGAEVVLTVNNDSIEVDFAGEGAAWINLRWCGRGSGHLRYLGDHWERSYGDLEWRGDAPNRPMPWYFMAFDGTSTHGYGVRTGAGAMCFWTADQEGISLWGDVRSGGVPVELAGRTLRVAEIVCREGSAEESSFAATRAFCRDMCLHPRLVHQPVYGTNDWNYAYGNNSAELIAEVGGIVSDHAQNSDNRPFSVIDEGWAMGPFEGRFGYGPWEGNPRFGDMASFSARLKGLGVRPGIWIRPLTPLPGMSESWRLSRDPTYLDPTVPEVQDHVRREIQKLVAWGYELIKHDFTTFDLLGKWGFEMGASPTRDGWTLNDRSRTNAEVLSDLYHLIRAAAGETLLIGCNTVGHLAAGYHEIQRTGDDTSGRSWNRNRRMGVNTLAFRAPQHRAFFDVDPDIVAITTAMPWNLVEQWLRLVSESGTSLFVAIEPSALGGSQVKALRRALDLASSELPVGEPLDWMDSQCPSRWKLMGEEEKFSWIGPAGPWPFPD